MRKIITILCSIVFLSACENKPKFDVINDSNIEEFIAAYAGDAGSGSLVGADLDLTVAGIGVALTHGGASMPNLSLNLPEPYKYVLLKCGNLMTDYSNYNGRLTNKSPVFFGTMQSEGDPAFKLAANECEKERPEWLGDWRLFKNGERKSTVVAVVVAPSDSPYSGGYVFGIRKSDGTLKEQCGIPDDGSFEVICTSSGGDKVPMSISGDEIIVTEPDGDIMNLRRIVVGG